MAVKLTTRDSWTTYQNIIEGRQDFATHGALYGVSYEGEFAPSPGKGRLPTEWYDSVNNADYVIYSYHTPIAWHGPDGWTFPDESYSVTTTRHQGKIFFVRDWT